MTKKILVVDNIVAEQHNLGLSLSDLVVDADQVCTPLQGSNGLILQPLCLSTLLKEVSPWI